MSRYLDSRYRQLTAYTPGEQPRDRRYIKLNTNESPYPPAPQVLAAVGQEQMAELRLYPDPECAALRQGLAGYYGLAPENVFVSNGSDDILNFAFMAWGEQGAAWPEISYSFYPVYARLHGIAADPRPMGPGLTVDIEAFRGLGQLIVIANPNAPTGLALSRSQAEDIVRSNQQSVVVIDEAYVDFGAESCVELTRRYDNLLVVMTYSKSRAMAGARLGFALGAPQLIADLELLKYSTNPYSLNRLTIAAGLAALAAAPYYKACCERIAATRQQTRDCLMEQGFEVLPSLANFLFARHPKVEGAYLAAELKRRGVLVRHFDDPRISEYDRISIGTAEDMAALLRETKEIISCVKA